VALFSQFSVQNFDVGFQIVISVSFHG
jgi:hypothetical protein